MPNNILLCFLMMNKGKYYIVDFHTDIADNIDTLTSGMICLNRFHKRRSEHKC